jgi:hypothetical protein
MKFAIALVVAGFVSSFAVVTPANAQKDPACIEKCNRDNKTAGGGRQARGTGKLVGACVQACPTAKAGKK